MTKLKYTFKTDTLFKMLFIRYPELLKKLVAELLGIKVLRITRFLVINPEMPPGNMGDKFCRLDINMEIDGQKVDLEIQVNNEGDYPERALFHWAREYSSSLPAGEGYSKLPRTIILSIIDFSLFDFEEFHSEFLPLEAKHHLLLSNKMSIQFFELPKVPKDLSSKDMLLMWLSLFRADTVEELSRIKELEVSDMDQALSAYYSITASSEFREYERLREKARHDEAQAIYNAERRGKIAGKAEGEQQRAMFTARNMINDGEPIEKIMRYTGLTSMEIANIRA